MAPRTVFLRSKQDTPPVPTADGFHDCEYTLPVASKGKYRAYRFLLISGYVLLAIGYCLLFTVGVMIPTMIAILPMLLWILVRATWQYVSYERRTEIRSGELICSKLYGRRRHEVLRVRAKELLLATPYTEKYLYLSERHGCKKTYDLRSGTAPIQCYIAVFRREDGAYAVIFDATRALVRAMAYYNKQVTVDDDYLRI